MISIDGRNTRLAGVSNNTTFGVKTMFSVENGKVAMLSDVIDALPARAEESKVTISEENWEQLRHKLCYPGGMSGLYAGQSCRAFVPCETKNGKGTRAHFCVWITRTEHAYEFGTNT